MIYNVIPINYAGGSGGQFLSALLYDAHVYNTTNWIFSKDGNAHDAEKEGGCTLYGLGKDPTGKLNTNFLIDYAKTVPGDVTVYPHGHYADPDLLMNYVHKQIKIYYEHNQLDEIIGMFMLKHPDTANYFRDLTILENIKKYKNHPIVQYRKFVAPQFSRLCNSCPDLEPRMLNISWNDMLYNDPDVLISKLHQFTEIPKENFNKDKFAEWRMLTHKTVDRLKHAGLI